MKDIIESMPGILLYIVPGFILLAASRSILPENKEPDNFLLIRSLVLSVVIVQVAGPLLALRHLQSSTGWGFVFILLISVLLGGARGRYLQSALQKKVNQALGIQTNAAASVWNLRMRNSKGQWARIYLDAQKIMYEGFIADYSLDPDSIVREVFLGRPRVYRLTDSGGTVLERDLDGVQEAGVLLNASVITRIEIEP